MVGVLLFQVSELQRLDHQVKDQIMSLITYAEKLVAGKMTKATYIESEKSVQAKKEDLCQKMENLMASF